jgi:hypothetical protein
MKISNNCTNKTLEASLLLKLRFEFFFRFLKLEITEQFHLTDQVQIVVGLSE